MIWASRVMIVPAAFAPLARALCAGVAEGDAGARMFEVGLSADGTGEPSHFISAGCIDEAFAALLPLTTIGEEGETKAPGQPEIVLQLADAAGAAVTLDQIQALFDAADITEGDPHARLATLGLKLIQPAEL